MMLIHSLTAELSPLLNIYLGIIGYLNLVTGLQFYSSTQVISLKRVYIEYGYIQVRAGLNNL
jgi:hypothetical protein